MFTVLIQNEKTMNSFYDHLPLFNGFLHEDENEKTFEVCEWNESGNTIEEMLPDLHALTDDKSSWRAVIVRYEDGPELARHPHAADNPYDFLDHHQDPQKMLENPLLRLAAMLERPLEYFDESRAGSMRGIWESLPKYSGVLPESITLISIRPTDSLLSVPEAQRLILNPDFAHTNGYPSFCRFAVFDCFDQGPIRKRKNDFMFWNLVLMLVINRVDASYMEAYRLYRLGMESDPEEMNRIWNQEAEELTWEEERIRHFLSNQSVYLEQYEGNYPDYSVEAQGFDLKVHSSAAVLSPKDYTGLWDEPEMQGKSWMQKAKSEISEITSLWNSLPDEVQKKTPAFSRRGGYNRKDVEVLSPRQRERLISELSHLKEKINDEYRSLPDQKMKNADALEEEADSLMQMFNLRPSKRKLNLWTISFCLVCFLSVLSAWIAYAKIYRSSLMYLIILSLVLVLIPLGLRMQIVLEDRRKVSAAIASWNHKVAAQYDRLDDYLRDYLKYESDLLSYRQGKSYLDLSKDVREEIREKQILLERTAAELEVFEQKLKDWAKAMNIELAEVLIDREKMDYGQLRLPEVKEKLFGFIPERSDTCEVNETGQKIQAPFSFITKLKIEAMGRRKKS